MFTATFASVVNEDQGLLCFTRAAATQGARHRAIPALSFSFSGRMPRFRIVSRITTFSSASFMRARRVSGNSPRAHTRVSPLHGTGRNLRALLPEWTPLFAEVQNLVAGDDPSPDVFY